jgi:hypothetical protein
MEHDKEEIRDKSAEITIKDTEVFSLGYLIDSILDYYSETQAEGDSSETWKKGTEHESVGSTEVPEEINTLIELAFKTQLKKFI